MKKVKKVRLDDLIVSKGLANSRTQAKSLILSGKVKLGTERLEKPGRSLLEDSVIQVEAPPRFVGRGGEKLEGMFELFKIPVEGLRVLDVGASTGGFTDCCLQRGASEVTCVDVGRAQLHNKLIQDKRVTNIEKTNARYLKVGDLPHSNYPFIVMDLSFISLIKVLPAIWRFISPSGHLVALIKPQFEAEKHEVDLGRGIIRNGVIHDRILASIQRFAQSQLDGSELVGTMDSPIKGTDGNREFLIVLRSGHKN